MMTAFVTRQGSDSPEGQITPDETPWLCLRQIAWRHHTLWTWSLLPALWRAGAISFLPLFTQTLNKLSQRRSCHMPRIALRIELMTLICTWVPVQTSTLSSGPLLT